ncbi:RNB domain-containing ribonuclease [Thermogemmatispora sp.]|uniref:RNB domain-containing ribonuclease n=1 Tax=Thermogemmatispora sp. TaxID=1968838 RepID=UPI001D5D4459|nr:RNB domain-containing ribonuclease [Thermogemmatispora sp.]MBX5450515.1 RNB domain-containing ribonuclease [Thermogemmatispora sp.]
MATDAAERERSSKRFSEAARAEAREAIGRLTALLKGRPQVKGITIDGPASRDLDDALWLEPLPAGGALLQISIADVASVVTPQLTPALEREAQQRAFTRYYANHTAPLLPRLLSEDHLSLLEGQARPALTLTLPFDAEWQPGEPHLTLTCCTSVKRLSYAEADALLSEPEGPLGSMLRALYRLAEQLFQLRRARGSLALYDLHRGWATSEEGFLLPLRSEQRHRSYLLIQECMILANQIFAQLLAQRGLPALYRNHCSKPIAPAGEVLRELLETALLRPDQVRPEQVSATIQLVVERATYAPTLRGHFGLQLPAYLHLTSPLRRYADLVNQRILLSLVQPAEAPSIPGREELEKIASHLNEVERSLKEEKPAYFLSLYEQQLQRQVEEALAQQGASPRPLAGMDARRFHSLIRIAAQSQLLPPVIEEEILARLQADALGPHDLFTLLFRFPTADQAWERIRRAALSSLCRQPQHAMSLLAMGQQILGWEAPLYEEKTSSGKGEPPSFTACASLCLAGQCYRSATYRAQRKDRARQLACADLVVRISGLGLEEELTPLLQAAAGPPCPNTVARGSQEKEREEGEQEQPTRKERPGPVAEEISNYKGTLQELAHQQRWGAPCYRLLARSGPAHAPHFIAECELTIAGEGYRASGQGSSRVRAEQEAARNLLLRLPLAPEQRQALLGLTEHSAMRLLNELLQRRRIERVEYAYTQGGLPQEPVFTATCLVTLCSGHLVHTSAERRTKRAAARAAALEMLKALRTLMDEQGFENH